MGRDFGRVYGSTDLALHVYRYSDCYLIANRATEEDAKKDNPGFIALGTWGGIPAEELYVLAPFVIESLVEQRDPSKARSDNCARPLWYGVRFVPWKGSRAILVEPAKLRWFALALTAPLALGLIRLNVRRRRQRRGACMHCGYSLFGCPSSRCPECGESFAPPALAEAPARAPYGAP
ncbi:MAG: hypothetical protein AMXMBFR47_08950 [Planctomycetota bacterium]